MSSEAQSSKKYHKIRLFLLLIDIVITLGFLIFLQLSGTSARLNAWAFSTTDRSWLQVLIYMTCFFNLLTVVSLPTHLYSGFVLERRFNLSDQKLRRWAWDELKKYLLSISFFLLTMELLYFAVTVFPKTWWLLAGSGWLFLTLFLTRIFPTLIIPLFYPTKPLPEGELKDGLLNLCKKCRVKVLGVYELALSRKTRKANAALVGLWGSRRILLGDTLTKAYTTPEIEMVVAHELGHHVKRHILRAFVFNTALTFAGFYLLYACSERITLALGGSHLADLSIFPALVLLVFVAGLFVLPLQNGFSRWQENQADRFALETLPSREVFNSLMNRLGEQNLADFNPNPWIEFFLYDHPSIAKRLKRASDLFEKGVIHAP